MKYFTYDLLKTINNESLSGGKIEEAEKQWNKNALLYSEIFNNLSDKLPIEVYNRFKNYGFHDYQLQKLEIEHTSLFHTDVHLTITDEVKAWKLSFINITSLQFKHLNTDEPCPIFNPESDDWVESEFLQLDDRTLSFEVLFTSGANLQVSFINGNVLLQQLT